MRTRSGKRRRISLVTIDHPPDSPAESESESVFDHETPSDEESAVSTEDTESEESVSETEPEAVSVIKRLFGSQKINRANEDLLEDLATDWQEGFDNEEEAEEYRETLEKYVAHYNSVPTIGEIMKLPNVPEEDRRELIDMRLSLDTDGIETSVWRKIRNKLKLRVDYYAGRLPENSTEAREAVGIGKNLGEAIRSATHLTENRRDRLLSMHRELSAMNHGSDEAPKLEKRIRIALSLKDGLPPPRITNPLSVLQKFRGSVDSELYGLSRPKEEMLCFLNSHLTSPNAPGCVLGIESAPGMGKTSLAIAMAKAIGCGWYKIPMGSLTESSQLSGSQPVFTGSTPGMVLEAVKCFESGMGILILDEVDKINLDSHHGSGIISVLLELLDFSQNHAFNEAYLQIPLDLSKIIIIVTMNNREKINPIVLNRIQTLIKLDSYSYRDRLEILRSIMVPKYLEKYELSSTVEFTESALHAILELSPKSDKGMRPPENALKTVLSRVKLYRTCVAGGDTSLVNFVLPEFSLEMYRVTAETVQSTAGHLKQREDVSHLMLYR